MTRTVTSKSAKLIRFSSVLWEERFKCRVRWDGLVDWCAWAIA